MPGFQILCNAHYIIIVHIDNIRGKVNCKRVQHFANIIGIQSLACDDFAPVFKVRTFRVKQEPTLVAASQDMLQVGTCHVKRLFALR